MTWAMLRIVIGFRWVRFRNDPVVSALFRINHI